MFHDSKLKPIGITEVCRAPRNETKKPNSRRAPLYTLVIALIPYSSLDAPPSPLGQRPDFDRGRTVAGGGPSSSNIYDESSRGSRLDSVPRPPVSSVVTLHQLEHHVPGRAIKEYERALKVAKKVSDEEA